ncbi:putative RNA-directed DNA polymerase from transposon X-element [Trichonephila clavipes]|nr:putative RNA-directed DNA polymerase from transposon X-element [Trichonephila clavipes]
MVFMDDNAACHRTLAVQDCLDSEGIQRLVWPAHSPDLNPIENVWDALGRQVAGPNYPPTNKNTLIRALTEEWNKLPQQLLDNVVQSMQLQDKFSRLETIQEEISDLLLISDELKNTYQEDFSKAEEYRDKFCQICSLLEASQEQTILVLEENISVEKRKFKLPKLELRKFRGEPKDFLAFWSQFKTFQLDTTIAEDKFQYFLQRAVPDSKAARLVSSFPPTKDNYSKAITQLKERFGRDELLVQIYVRDLLSIVMKNAAGWIKVDLCRSYTIY